MCIRDREEGPFNQLHGLWIFKPLGEKACKISLDLSFDYACLLYTSDAADELDGVETVPVPTPEPLETSPQ